MQANQLKQTGPGVVGPAFRPGGGVGRLLLVLLLAVQACCDDDPAPGPSLQSVSVAPEMVTVTVGRMAAFTAHLSYVNGQPSVRPPLEWSVSDPTIAGIDANGQATALAPGLAIITARAGGKSGSARLTVTMAPAPTPVGLTLQPDSGSILVGTTLALAALAELSDGAAQVVSSSALWSSSDPAIAEVGAGGVVTGIAPGVAEVSATFGALTASATITVSELTVKSLAIAPGTLSLPQGASQQYTAIATYSDDSMAEVTAEVLWASGAMGIATVSNEEGSEGRVTALALGEATITATLKGASASVPLTVIPALLELALDPPAATIAPGSSLALSARGRFSDGSRRTITDEVAWQSSVEAVATVRGDGQVSGLAAGEAVITGRVGGQTRSIAIIVTGAALVSLGVQPTKPRLAALTSQRLSAVGVFADGVTQDLTESVQWSSASPEVASVSTAPGSRGQVRGLTPGRVSVSASFAGKTSAVALTITAATLQSLSILPPALTIAAGTAAQLRATGLFSDGSSQDLTDQVSWEPASASVAAAVSGGVSAGQVTGTSVGATMIRARWGAVGSEAALTVTGATLRRLTVSPPDARLARGTMVALRVAGEFSDDSTQDLTSSVFWSAGPPEPALASVGNAPPFAGLVKALQPGTATVIAHLQGMADQARIEITSATLSSISVTPADPPLATGLSLRFQALGTFSDGSTQPLDREASWTTSDETRAVISNVPGSTGLATALAEGSATVTARFAGQTGTSNLLVGPPALVRLTIAPPGASIPRGTSIDLRATGHYTDGSSRDLTGQVFWESGAAGVASVSSVAPTSGRVLGKLVGSVTITAQLGDVLAHVAVRITSATLTGLSISPADASLASGGVLPFQALGTFSDGSAMDVTPQAMWASSQPAVAAISNDPAVEGRATAIAPGSTSISATFMGMTVATGLTVTP